MNCSVRKFRKMLEKVFILELLREKWERFRAFKCSSLVNPTSFRFLSAPDKSKNTIIRPPNASKFRLRNSQKSCKIGGPRGQCQLRLDPRISLTTFLKSFATEFDYGRWWWNLGWPWQISLCKILQKLHFDPNLFPFLHFGPFPVLPNSALMTHKLYTFH